MYNLLGICHVMIPFYLHCWCVRVCVCVSVCGCSCQALNLSLSLSLPLLCLCLFLGCPFTGSLVETCISIFCCSHNNWFPLWFYNSIWSTVLIRSSVFRHCTFPSFHSLIYAWDHSCPFSYNPIFRLRQSKCLCSLTILRNCLDPPTNKI